jgi:hypothetical protein
VRPSSPPPRPGAPTDERAGDRGPLPALTALAPAAKDAFVVAVGLTVLGLQRFQAERPALEAELRSLGLGPLADASERVGDALRREVDRLLAPQAPRTGPRG